ncbi:hypothetical protein JHK82_043007 [Glycine max]|uniref:Uncharacterized protein n=2 Tax=Glycine subgen. Soja TaxID=1462606 RepID=K7MCM5_SOYBN|nr:hypothetical protein JHK87_042948 [Glycine soja]KAG4949788.1 hypothetical protein JHK86_043027 [Glycine max]KAG4957277.1 hypothetical protein JHK85_043657 [Glycine max]KAG5106037.1 hypothetical protein JHK82_043007 [Glycine max]KAG5117107.1 hypothetical protein JHK84_043220 [Glycine max]
MASDPGQIRDLVWRQIQPFHEHNHGVSAEGSLVRHLVPRLSRLVHQNAQILMIHLVAPPPKEFVWVNWKRKRWGGACRRHTLVRGAFVVESW